jgi:23S rRNA (uracil1939-C5)-methyltransferase
LINGTWQQGSLLDVDIDDLNHQGEGVGRWQGRVIFVPDTVTGDRITVRLLRIKPSFAQGKLVEIIAPSPWRIRPRCIVADKCGGCQWQHVADDYQLQAKRDQVINALVRIGGFADPPLETAVVQGKESLGYRNKVTYPLGRSETGSVQTGYYRRHSHQLINLNQCPVQDPRLNPLLAEIKGDIQSRGWSIYNEAQRHGKLRHLSLRIGRRTGEIYLTLISTSSHLDGLAEQAAIWGDRYHRLVGVAVNVNSKASNVIFGQETSTIWGKASLLEEFAGLSLELRPDTFFQVNTEAAENLFFQILAQLNLQGHEQIIDAYCGIGTFTLPLAQHVQQVIGLESQIASVQQAKANAQLNGLNNVSFIAGSVEEQLPQLDLQPDLIWLDPPRKGCDRLFLETLRNLAPQQIVYMSCQPATLARDLKLLCESGHYQLKWLQVADFFPQTAHVETAVLLERVN